jgi:hypothetical protein
MLLLLLAGLLLLAAVTASSLLAAGASPEEVVARETARNEAAAERDAARRPDLIRLPPGAVSSPTRPSGVGERLAESPYTLGGETNVNFVAYWTAPESQQQVFRFLRAHPPRGARPESESFGSGGPSIEFDWRRAPKGVWFASVVVTVVKRAGGGSALRADVTDSWEIPRSPAARIPGRPHFLLVHVKPIRQAIFIPEEEGEEEPPPAVPRFNSSGDQALIASVVRLVEREPANQITGFISCGPPGFEEDDLIELLFMDHRGGRVLATVSRETGGGPCDVLRLHPRGGKTYGLGYGYPVAKRVEGLVEAARPRDAKKL